MAYIYQITNQINGKIYIGKTERTIQERWREHCEDYLRERCYDRPLYRAMRKYGLSNFTIELLEETDNPEEREIFWIEQKGSFKHGYNATNSKYENNLLQHKELRLILALANLLLN